MVSFDLHYFIVLVSILGCLNTPAKGSRQCNDHADKTTKFRDDSKDMIHHEQKVPSAEIVNETESEDVLAIKIVNDKETRSGKCFEVKNVQMLCRLLL